MSEGAKRGTKASAAAAGGGDFSCVRTRAPSEEAQLVARPSDISREAGNPDLYVKTDFLFLFKFYQ